MERTATVYKARLVWGLTSNCTQPNSCEKKSNKTMILRLPSPRVLSAKKKSSLGPTFLFFRNCQHTYQLQNFNQGSFHGDGNKPRRVAVAIARAGDRPRQRSPVTCTPYGVQQSALKKPGWQRPRAGREIDAQGPRFRATPPPPSRVFPSWEKLSVFSLCPDLTLWHSGGPGIHFAGWQSHFMLRATQNTPKEREFRRCQEF